MVVEKKNSSEKKEVKKKSIDVGTTAKKGIKHLTLKKVGSTKK